MRASSKASLDAFSDNTTAIQIDGGTATIGDLTNGGAVFTDNAVAVDMNGDGTADLVGNTMTENTVAGVDVESGSATISSNTISFDVTPPPGSTVTSVGIVVGTGAGPTPIDNNTITGEFMAINEKGLPGSNKPKPSNITRNSLSGNTIGIDVDSASVQIGTTAAGSGAAGDGNTFTNDGTAVDVEGDGSAVLVGNTITGGAGDIGIDDSSSGAVDSTDDTIEGASGDFMLTGQRMHKPFASATDTITGDTIEFAQTGIDDEGNSITVSRSNIGNNITGISITKEVDSTSPKFAIGATGTGNGNTFTDNSTGIEISDVAGGDLNGDGIPDFTDNTITGGTGDIGIDDNSTGPVTSTGDSFSGDSTGALSTGVRARKGSISMTADEFAAFITGVEVDGGNAVTVDSSTIGGNGGLGGAGGNATGGARVLYVLGGAATVQNGTEMIDNTTGIEVAGGTVTVDGSSISGGTTGILVDAGQSATMQNGSSISGAATGVDIEGGSAHIIDSSISDCTIDGVKNDSETGVSSVSLTAGSTLSVSDNATGIEMSGGATGDTATLDSTSQIIVGQRRGRRSLRGHGRRDPQRRRSNLRRAGRYQYDRDRRRYAEFGQYSEKTCREHQVRGSGHRRGCEGPRHGRSRLGGRGGFHRHAQHHQPPDGRRRC